MTLNYAILADVLLVLHALVVLFNLGALPVIWLGYFRGWVFVRNFWFRFIHLALLAIVALESVFGLLCPLTRWEDALRSKTGAASMEQAGFVARWLNRLLYYDFPDWVFATAYLGFFALGLFTFYCVPPRRPRCARRED